MLSFHGFIQLYNVFDSELAPNVHPFPFFLNAWQFDIHAASSICALAWRCKRFFVHRGRHLLPLVFSPARAAQFFLFSAHRAYDYGRFCTRFSWVRGWLASKVIACCSRESRSGSITSPLTAKAPAYDQHMVSSPLMIMRSFFLEEHSRSLTWSTVCSSGCFNSDLRPIYANLAELARQISILSLLKLISIFKIWSMPVRNIASTLHVYATCISKAGGKWGGGGGWLKDP